MESARYSILLVEDNKLDQMAFTRYVESQELPYDSTIAASVCEARRILETESFDVVITDYLLGDRTAFDILDSVKNIPVIFVTGAGDEEIATRAWKAGAYDYVVKDHDLHYLKTIPITVENAIEHKRMKQRLHLLSHAIISTNDSVYITDLQDKITFVNKAFCETYGYTEKEIVGKDCNTLWERNPSVIDSPDSYEAVDGWEIGFFHRRKDGSAFPVSLSRSDVKDENENEVAIVIVARDISERMQIEQSLRNSCKELKRQNRQQKELLIAVCRQLTAPMDDLKNVILTSQSDAAFGHNPRLQENLKQADEKIERVRNIISNFLDISQVASEPVATY